MNVSQIAPALPVVHIGTDHAGWELTAFLADELRHDGYVVVEHRSPRFEADDDYPAFCVAAGREVAAAAERGEQALAIVIGGSGNGEQIAANKVAGVRAALVWNERTARLARQHNDANVMAVGAREHGSAECLHFARVFLQEPFTAEARHCRRIAQVAAYEESPLALAVVA